MADKTDTIRQEIKESRQNIEDTRSAMTEKLAILEDRVQETVDGVKHTFDLHYQMKQRPWLMFGGSVLTGYMLGPRGRRSSATADQSSEPSYHAQPQQNTGNQVKGAFATIREAALGAMINTLWAMAKQVLLPSAPQTDNPATMPGAEPTDTPQQITNRVITSKANGRSDYRDAVKSSSEKLSND